MLHESTIRKRIKRLKQEKEKLVGVTKKIELAAAIDALEWVVNKTAHDWLQDSMKDLFEESR